MKSHLRLNVLLITALLIATVLAAGALLRTREQRTAKIQEQAPAKASSPVMETPPSSLQKPLPVPARREADKNILSSSTAAAPQVVESNTRKAAQDADVSEAKSPVSKESSSLVFSSAKDLRPRAQKGLASQDTAQQNSAPPDEQNVTDRKPIESRLKRAGRSFTGDLRDLPYEKLVETEMPEHEDPLIIRRSIGKPVADGNQVNTAPPIVPAAPAPTPLNVFDGLDRFNFGAGSPPDTNGDVGPQNYIQNVNTSIGIYNKSTGVRDAAFTFNTLMSQGNFGNLCDTNNFGDPVVLYDTFEDRWIITDFAFLLDGSNNVLAPAFQCFAASKTGDPILGGWNFYSIQITDNLNDYPKLGIWPDGLYMSANLFSFGAGSTFQGARVWAFNKAQMYAGAPTVQIVSFNVGGGDFTLIPSNARLQTGTPPAGTPNYFLSTWLFTNALTVYKFHVDWDRISLTTFTGPDIPIAATSWPNANVANAAQPGTATLLDVLQIRAMVQNQYTNFSGVESLWAPHTVRRANTSGLAAPRWYQVNVTGGTVAASLPQATTWDPDGANVINRFMPSLALDRAGNMALGYSTSSGAAFPSIKYAGRLSTDPVNTFSLTEQLFFAGTASQTGSTRWGDYSVMTLDPNGCTFWYTSEYANPADQSFDHRWLTKFGSFRFSPCTTIGNGTLQGTVTTSPGGSPISGATVAFGARTATTNGSGFYSFPAIPAGTYPTETASKPGFNSSTTTNIVITEAVTTIKDFALTSAPASACLVDTTQPDFQLGVFSSGIDVNTSPGDVTLLNAPTVDQQNTAGTTTGTSFGTPNWTGQTFIPAVTGTLAKADVQLFCNGCGATPPNLTLSVRNTTGGLPTGADLATATIPGSVFSSGASVTFTASFGSPATLTAGTQYALILRPVAVPSGAGYFWIRSSPSTYANGQRVLSANSGGTWSGDSTRDYNFKAYMQTGFAASGDLVSSLKDGNPAAGTFNHWSYISWNAVTPANTTLKFQVAASNSPFGPFNFVGPDGTAATFFTTINSSLFQFGSLRYLKYKAYLSTTNSAVTPTLNDVTVCYFNSASPTAAGGAINGTITDSDGAAISGVTIQLSGNGSRKTITDASGHYSFDNVDTNGLYTTTPSRVNYTFSPQNRSFSLLGAHAEASFTAAANSGSNINPLDTADYFVRQQYVDFLGREPDESGFVFWSNEVNSCGNDQGCVERKRINVSAAFFLSIEFQQTGYEVYRLYKAAYGNLPGAPVPVRLSEFRPDTAEIGNGVIVNRSGWEQQLESNKQGFASEFVQRNRFISAYPTMLTPAQFVDQLFANTGVTPSGDERTAAISEFGSASDTSDAAARGRALRLVAENPKFAQQESNQAFVLMQYFGYLRRDPNSGPDTDFAGYNFWLNKLNTFGNFQDAEMVKAFLVSGEYRGRFPQ
jgi:hypothetical protein